jgi:4-azaleucine resistance transporter AzlC
LLLTALLALLINIRYSMYGISLVRYFRNYPWYIRYYLIWTLTDETYALESSTRLRGKKRMYYSLLVGGFDHLYWITGSVIGAIAGSCISFDPAGIDFAMTALFLVILVDLVREKKNRIPALTGGVSTLLALAFFVAFFPAQVNRMLLAAMVLMIAVLLLLRKKACMQKGSAQ